MTEVFEGTHLAFFDFLEASIHGGLKIDTIECIFKYPERRAGVWRVTFS